MIKLTSPGPVFYRARRQGLHGKEFDCLKFRTMMLRADTIQERLRVVNQVDGPQFKIDNDPRISGVGKFLRDTCIDELPQFINVLLGQMSVVGPRPSPENENDSCPVGGMPGCLCVPVLRGYGRYAGRGKAFPISRNGSIMIFNM